jgi:hypothetical protein
LGLGLRLGLCLAMVVPLVEKVPGNADYRRAVVSSEIPLQGTGAFGMLLILQR